jgi:hypothetical protein
MNHTTLLLLALATFPTLSILTAFLSIITYIQGERARSQNKELASVVEHLLANDHDLLVLVEHMRRNADSALPSRRSHVQRLCEHHRREFSEATPRRRRTDREIRSNEHNSPNVTLRLRGGADDTEHGNPSRQRPVPDGSSTTDLTNGSSPRPTSHHRPNGQSGSNGRSFIPRRIQPRQVNGTAASLQTGRTSAHTNGLPTLQNGTGSPIQGRATRSHLTNGYIRASSNATNGRPRQNNGVQPPHQTNGTRTPIDRATSPIPEVSQDESHRRSLRNERESQLEDDMHHHLSQTALSAAQITTIMGLFRTHHGTSHDTILGYPTRDGAQSYIDFFYEAGGYFERAMYRWLRRHEPEVVTPEQMQDIIARFRNAFQELWELEYGRPWQGRVENGINDGTRQGEDEDEEAPRTNGVVTNHLHLNGIEEPSHAPVDLTSTHAQPSTPFTSRSTSPSSSHSSTTLVESINPGYLSLSGSTLVGSTSSDSDVPSAARRQRSPAPVRFLFDSQEDMEALRDSGIVPGQETALRAAAGEEAERGGTSSVERDMGRHGAERVNEQGWMYGAGLMERLIAVSEEAREPREIARDREGEEGENGAWSLEL